MNLSSTFFRVKFKSDRENLKIFSREGKTEKQSTIRTPCENFAGLTKKPNAILKNLAKISQPCENTLRKSLRKFRNLVKMPCEKISHT